jgi:hypothetical protein
VSSFANRILHTRSPPPKIRLNPQKRRFSCVSLVLQNGNAASNRNSTPQIRTIPEISGNHGLMLCGILLFPWVGN